MENLERPHRRDRRFRGSLVWPVVLISIGILFLLDNLNLLQQDVWETILLVWPVFFIAVGLEGLLRGGGIAINITVIAAATAILLGNLGYLAIDLWGTLLRLWPIFLIALGIDVIFGRRSAWGSLVAFVLIIAILAGGFLLFGVVGERALAADRQLVTQSLGDASRATINIEPGAARLSVHAEDLGDKLLTGAVSAGSSQNVQEAYSVQSGRAVYTLQTGGNPMIFPGRSSWRWNLALNKDIPVDLNVNLGAGEAKIDLSGMDISRLSLDMGVGNTEVTLPATGDFQAEIDGAVGQLILRIPRNVAVHLEADTGLANLSLPEDFREVRSGIYQNPAISQPTGQADVSFSQAIGNVNVQYVGGG